jgi:murein DD-endopeptidase MepM/ murein hydrolase activator NlpD
MRYRLIAVAVFVLQLQVFASPAASSSGWMVHYQPLRIVNGSPVIFRVTAPKGVRSLSGRWLGHDLEFTFDAQRKDWLALGGASLETKAGSYPIRLHAESAAGQAISSEKEIAVGRQRYPKVLLKVAGKYTAPSAEDQREIDEDKKTKEEAFKTLSPEREWRGSFAAPVATQVSDVFGTQRVFNGSVQSTHQGLDFHAPAGTSVAAVNDGRVILARPLFFEGNCIVIDHGQGLLTLYLHLSKFLVKEGDQVKKLQPIGLSGGTGRATGPHLHLAVRWQGVYLDPQALLKLKLP